MSEPQTWREQLAEIIKNTGEKQRIAAALGIHPFTLERWAQGEVAPRQHNLQRLFEVVPHLRPLLPHATNVFDTKERDASFSAPAQVPMNGIPVTFYGHVIDLYASSPAEQRFWSISTAVLRDMRERLAQNRVGLQMSLVQCVAPSQGNTVQYLREQLWLGTHPWNEQGELRARLFGAESLPGYVVSRCYPEVIENLNDERWLTYEVSEHALSAAAYPILHTGRVAGCLFLLSSEPDYFRSPMLQQLIQSYTMLLTLAFQLEDFYPPQSIALRIMPSPHVQRPYFLTIQQRIMSVLKQADAEHRSMSYQQAEQHAWWQIAEELFQLPLRAAPET
jgi:hypothetical protein